MSLTQKSRGIRCLRSATILWILWQLDHPGLSQSGLSNFGFHVFGLGLERAQRADLRLERLSRQPDVFSKSRTELAEHTLDFPIGFGHFRTGAQLVDLGVSMAGQDKVGYPTNLFVEIR